jgi:hypothetical protein
MERLKLILILLIISLSSFAQQKPDENCEVKGIKLMGEVEVVDFNGDLLVYVSEYEGMYGFEVELRDIASSCGDWVVVEDLGDFTIEFVTYEFAADIVITLYDNEASRAFIEKYNLSDNW